MAASHHLRDHVDQDLDVWPRAVPLQSMHSSILTVFLCVQVLLEFGGEIS